MIALGRMQWGSPWSGWSPGSAGPQSNPCLHHQWYSSRIMSNFYSWTCMNSYTACIMHPLHDINVDLWATQPIFYPNVVVDPFNEAPSMSSTCDWVAHRGIWPITCCKESVKIDETPIVSEICPHHIPTLRTAVGALVRTVNNNSEITLVNSGVILL